jgi:hypothetical protein
MQRCAARIEPVGGEGAGSGDAPSGESTISAVGGAPRRCVMLLA